jgi:hypothetical protein
MRKVDGWETLAELPSCLGPFRARFCRRAFGAQGRNLAVDVLILARDPRVFMPLHFATIFYPPRT